MCLSCGCRRVDDRHGHPDHIAYDDLKAAADAAGIGTKKAAKNIVKTLKRAAKAAKHADSRTTINDVGR